jgi:hypothetical protein
MRTQAIDYRNAVPNWALLASRFAGEWRPLDGKDQFNPHVRHSGAGADAVRTGTRNPF